MLLNIFMHLHHLTAEEYSAKLEKEILAQGELMSTNMVTNYLKELGVKVNLIPALDYMRTDDNGEPDMPYIKEHLSDIMKHNAGYELYITQGFICRNKVGDIDNLQRGGSDYTACLIGAVLRLPKKSKYGLILMVCTTMTRVLCLTQHLFVSSTLKRLLNWLVWCQNSSSHLHSACSLCRCSCKTAKYNGSVCAWNHHQ